MRLTVFAVAACAAALLAACATTTTGTAGGAPAATGGNGSRAAPDPGDADRRAAVRMELASLHFSRGQYETALDEIKLAALQGPMIWALGRIGERVPVYGPLNTIVPEVGG